MEVVGHVEPQVALFEPFDIGETALERKFAPPFLDLALTCLEGDAEILDGTDGVIGGNLVDVWADTGHFFRSGLDGLGDVRVEDGHGVDKGPVFGPSEVVCAVNEKGEEGERLDTKPGTE